MLQHEFTLMFRLVAKITKPKNRKRTAILIIFYFLSIEKQEFFEFAFTLMDDVDDSVKFKLTQKDFYAIAWKMGVMKKDFKNEVVQKLVVFIFLMWIDLYLSITAVVTD